MPGVAVSTTSAVGPRPVRASTAQTAAIGLFVMKIYVPFGTNWSPLRAVVVPGLPITSRFAPAGRLTVNRVERTD